MKTYSFKKTLGKGVFSALTTLAAITVFAGWSDVSLWELIENYLKPLIGSLTVGGGIAMLINIAKFNLISKYE